MCGRLLPMSLLLQIIRPFRRAAAAVFHSDIGLKRGKGGVQFVLKDRAASQARQGTPSRAELAARREMQEFNLMRQQLAELLDDLPETRDAMRHLVFVEQALDRKGLRALHKVPLPVLQRALEQLEGLVVNWSPHGLAALRSKMAVAIIDREHLANDAEADAYRTSAVLDNLPDNSIAGLEVRSDDDALAAAYAALGDLAPAALEVQAELGSPSAKALQHDGLRSLAASMPPGGEIELREVQG